MRKIETTLVILAGGMGSRMGRPKGWLTIGGRPILSHLVDRLAWDGPTVLVTGQSTTHPPGWDLFDREMCDAVAGEGPLRGIATVLDSGVKRAVVMPVDMPAMRGDALRWLAEQVCDSGLFLRRGEEIMAMPMLLTSRATPVVRERLAQGRRSIYSLAEEPGFAVMSAPAGWPDDLWANVNEPADLEQFERGEH